MALSLSVPVATNSLPKEIETNPKKAKAWVGTLPLTKTIESATSMISMLESLNRGKLGADDRIELIEIYRPVIDVLLDEFEAVYAYSVLPLPQKQLNAFELARRLLTECGFAYKMLVLEKTGKIMLFNAKKNLPLPIYRTLVCLREQMLQSYKTYHPVPAGVWLEAHSLYQYAEEQGLLREGDAEAKSTILDIYTEMLLLALADPYRLMYKEVERAVEVLSQNRGFVDILSSTEGINPQRLFVTALDGDQAPKVLIQGNQPPAGQVLRLIDPTRLVERLSQKLKAAGNANVAKSRATHDFSDLIARLIRLWGDPPKRQFRRNPTDSGVALCSGIKSIAYFAELAANESPEADAEAIREGRTIPLLKIPRDPTSQMMGVEEWRVLNQSANGVRLHHESGGKVGVTVGEAVGVRFVGGRGWSVGVVRWLTLLEGNALEFGVELISPNANCITIEPTMGNAAGSTRIMPALLIAPLVGESVADTVLTLPEIFSDLREFELNDHDEISHVRATTLIERTSRFDLFQFQPS